MKKIRVRDLEGRLRVALKTVWNIREREYTAMKACVRFRQKKLGTIKIRIDLDQKGRIDAVVHELLHYIFKDSLKSYSNKVEEAIIVALEEEVVAFIFNDEDRIRAWRKLIRLKGVRDGKV